MQHQLPDLPWPADALAPGMSARTLELHHGEHHASYVEKLNKLIKGTKFEEMSLEDIVINASGGIFDNAAQHWNHSFFWPGLRPAGGAAGPEGELLEAIEARFESLDEFKKMFTASAIANFGSGWTWLITGRRGLEIVNTGNADTPLRNGKTPLLVCDVWEHAYYVDHQNRRPDYLATFWDLVDWERIAQRHAAADLRPAAKRRVSAGRERSSRA